MIQIAAIIGAVLFLAVSLLYTAVTFGAPLGEYLMGGKYRVLPPKVRMMTGVSVIIQLLVILVLLQAGGIIGAILPSLIIKPLGYFFAAYFSLNVVMNLFSKSKKEKILMTPLSLIASACLWLVIRGV
ncbi:MAG: hypothetical protein E6772_16080 [Dysgonomonas sp.]|nr:hypothetical protein [Dysgonomonas sp.]